MSEHQITLPVDLEGRPITREEAVEAMREIYNDFIRLTRKYEDPTLRRLPDYEALLDSIERFGFPPP